MEPRDFVYWLQGYFEINSVGKINADKAQIIQDHLNLTLKKETPVRRPDFKGIDPPNFGMHDDLHVSC